MSTLFGKLGLRKRRNKIVTGTVFSAAAAALVAGAVIHPGFKTTEVDPVSYTHLTLPTKA